MKPCEHLSQYLDGRMERAGREYFESHLDTCRDCQSILDMWRSAKLGLKKEASDRCEILTPTIEDANRLVERAKLEGTSRDRWSFRWLVPVAVTASVTFAVAWAVFGNIVEDDNPSADGDQTIAAAGSDLRDIQDRMATPALPVDADSDENREIVNYVATETGQTVGTLGGDRFGLGPSSHLSLVSVAHGITRLRLADGFAVFSVAPRLKGEKFIVEAGDVTVRVIGTRFSVDRSGAEVRVAVNEGKVEVVNRDGRLWHVNAGEILSLDDFGVADLSEIGEVESYRMAQLLGEVIPEAAAALLGSSDEDDAPPATAEDEIAMVFDVEEAIPSGVRAQAAPAGSVRAERTPALTANEDDIFMPENPAKSDDDIDPDNRVEADDGTASEEPNDAPMGIEQWRQWVLEGKLQEAEKALRGYLKRHPIDTDAMSLLADCLRKAGKHAASVATYKNIIAVAPSSQANRARFKAGVVMQENLGDHFGAAIIFEEYLATKKGSPLLTAKAMVRLARSLIELRERDRARKLLDQVISNHSGTSAAIKAREILEQILP